MNSCSLPVLALAKLPPMSQITQILGRIEAGDSHASEQLLPVVYDALRKLAASRMAAERPDHTLQPTALVHEAYLRLLDSQNADHWVSRAHFFGAAAEAMRRILVNHARSKATDKRGGNWDRVSLDAVAVPGGIDPEEMLALDDAIESLSELDTEAARIAKLRIFAGMTVPEAAEITGLPPRTIDRLWAFSRAWLRTQLAEA